MRSGRKYWPDQTPVAGQQFEYTYDDIGNRTATKAGGDQNGANLRSASYSANNLNQYTNRTVPGAVDVMGVGFATNAVTVNGQTAYRKGEYFRQEIPVSNGLRAGLAVGDQCGHRPSEHHRQCVCAEDPGAVLLRRGRQPDQRRPLARTPGMRKTGS